MSELSREQEKRPTANPADATPGYETSDTKGKAIFIGLLVSVVVITAISFALNEIFIMTREEITQQHVAMVENPELNEVRARTTRNLTTYEWADSAAGEVRIPIDRAMELMAEEAYVERSHEARSNQ